MVTPERTLGVAVCGTGWCASQHIAAFQKNPHARVTWLCARDADRARANLTKYGIALPEARITTRYARDFLPQALFAILHETGHALYEQHTAPDLDRTPLASGCSNVFHESQSRLWENVVGRSRGFWERHFPALQQTFPEQLLGVTVDEFYAAVNCVQPSLIRVVTAAA